MVAASAAIPVVVSGGNDQLVAAATGLVGGLQPSFRFVKAGLVAYFELGVAAFCLERLEAVLHCLSISAEAIT